MFGVQPLRQRADHFVVRAARAGRLDDLRPEDDVLVTAGLVHVVVLEEHGGRQHDVRDRRGFGHELLVHADEEVVAREPPMHARELRRDHHRIRALDEERGDGRTVAEVVRVAVENRPDARLIEDTDRRIDRVVPSSIDLSQW